MNQAFWSPNWLSMLRIVLQDIHIQADIIIIGANVSSQVNFFPNLGQILNPIYRENKDSKKGVVVRFCTDQTG